MQNLNEMPVCQGLFLGYLEHKGEIRIRNIVWLRRCQESTNLHLGQCVIPYVLFHSAVAFIHVLK